MGQLRNLKIVIGKKSKSASLFEELFPDINAIEYQKPNEYAAKIWNTYIEIRDRRVEKKSQSGVNGKFLEFIVASLLFREKIYPIYLNANVTFVPNINFDIILYSEEDFPICLSAKTSARERYKQADLEAFALKNVHRRALSYLITTNKKDADDINAKIGRGDILGLNKVYSVLENEFNDLIDDLKRNIFILSPNKAVINSSQIVQ